MALIPSPKRLICTTLLGVTTDAMGGYVPCRFLAQSQSLEGTDIQHFEQSPGAPSSGLLTVVHLKILSEGDTIATFVNALWVLCPTFDILG